MSGPLAEQSLAPPSEISASESSEEDAGGASTDEAEPAIVHEVNAETEIEAGSGPLEPDQVAALSPAIGEGGESEVPTQARSTDNGATWAQFGNPVVNRITTNTNLDDKEMFAIDKPVQPLHDDVKERI